MMDAPEMTMPRTANDVDGAPTLKRTRRLSAVARFSTRSLDFDFQKKGGSKKSTVERKDSKRVHNGEALDYEFQKNTFKGSFCRSNNTTKSSRDNVASWMQIIQGKVMMYIGVPLFKFLIFGPIAIRRGLAKMRGCVRGLEDGETRAPEQWGKMSSKHNDFSNANKHEEFKRGASKELLSSVSKNTRIARVAETMPTFPHVFFAIMAFSRMCRCVTWLSCLAEDLTLERDPPLPWQALAADAFCLYLPDLVLSLMVIPYFTSVARSLPEAAAIYGSGVSMAHMSV
jgi:hypothetical protein